MPRRYAPKRRLIRRKRLGRRPMRRMAPRRPNVYHFKRKVFYKDSIIVNAGTDYFNTWAFTLSTLPNYTDFTNLYDMYRVNKAVLKIIPKVTENALASGVSTANGNLQQIHSAIDYDDPTLPTTVNQLCEYQSHKMTRGNQIHTRVLVPKVELGDGTGASFPKSKQWIDCDNAVQLHRGIKLAIPAPAVTGTQMVYDVLVTLYISCKSVL